MAAHDGFELLQKVFIPELNTLVRRFRHLKTGAEMLSLENDDTNKVFGITFRTPPKDSTGIAHIMEHAVLCGSVKYPLKEPFIELEKGSLKTFLNAFTYPDRTCYPVASQNLQDFYNLIDVYMDAVLHPLITEQTFLQEGCHYELDHLDDPLVYKGIVFNEMKGVYSSPDGLLGRYSRQSLFPENTYGVDSGGSPKEIPRLTYAQFKAFHRDHYHPSNAFIYFYGDDDPDTRLRLVDNYISGFSKQSARTVVDLHPHWDKPRRINYPYDPGQTSEKPKANLTINWLLPVEGTGNGKQSFDFVTLLDAETSLALSMLSYVLLGTPASPLRKALLDSGLGEDVIGAGMDVSLRQPYFSCGLRGISLISNEGDLSNKQSMLVQSDILGQVEHLILETLESLVKHGIDPDTIAAAVNTIEFRLRENNTGSYPRGLLLMLRALPSWIYGGDPAQRLAFEEPLDQIKSSLERGEKFFEGLIKEYLLENPHRTTVIQIPEDGLRQEQEAAEREELERVREAMDLSGLQNILEITQQLKTSQETSDPPELLARIPSLRLEDLDPINQLIPIDVIDQDGSQILYHDLFTNGIVYLDVGLNLGVLPGAYIPYVPLFSRALLEIGTQSMDYVKLSQRIGRTTGGIYPATLISARYGASGSEVWLFLRGKSTLEHTKDLLDILKDVLLTVRFDNQERFKQLLLEEKSGMEAALIPAGHRFVGSRLGAMLHESGWVSELMGGVNYLYFLRELVDLVDRDWDKVLMNLENMRRTLVNKNAMVCNVTLDAENWRHFNSELVEFIGGFPEKTVEWAKWEPELDVDHQGLSIPSQVNSVGKAANIYKLGYKLHGSIYVINNYLRTTWLWERVRVQGGAYGGFCSFNHRSGTYAFLSYRDPNLIGTLENYDLAGSFLRELDTKRLSQGELTKSIIGAIGDMDAYQFPDAKGYTSMVRHLVGDRDQDRQRRREQVLSTTIKDFRTFAEVLERLKDNGRVVVMGSQEAIQKANASHPGLLQVEKVL